MTGVAHAVLASTNAVKYSVGVALFAGNYGYANPASGTSISPSTIKGKSIWEVYVLPGASQFRISIADETLPQGYFQSILVQDSNGNMIRRLSSATVTFASGGGVTAWTWGSSNLWTTTHASRDLLIFY